MHLPSPSQEQASPVTLHRAPAAILKSHFAEQTLPHSPPVFLSPGNSRAPGRKKLGARGFAAVLLNTHRVCRKLGEGIRSKTSLERSSIPAAHSEPAAALPCLSSTPGLTQIPRYCMALCPLQWGTGPVTFSKNTCCHLIQSCRSISVPAPGNRAQKSSSNKQSTI